VVVKAITQGAGITLGADGSIAMVIAAADTAAFVLDTTQLKYVKGGRTFYRFGVYELKMTSPANEVRTLLAGTVYLGPAVIKAGA
jgi:hypothetical protein